MVIHSLHPLLERPELWAAHLSQLYGIVFDDGLDGNTFVETVFGTTFDALNRLWQETGMERPDGDWPVVQIPAATGYFITMRMVGTPDYEDRYTFSSAGSRDETILGYGGGNFMLPAFRWAEVKAIAAASGSSSQALLILLPATHLNSDELESGNDTIRAALKELGFSTPALVDFVPRLVDRLHQDIHWTYDRELGWTTDYRGTRRCPQRSKGRLSGDELRRFRELTDLLGVAPSRR